MPLRAAVVVHEPRLGEAHEVGLCDIGGLGRETAARLIRCDRGFRHRQPGADEHDTDRRRERLDAKRMRHGKCGGEFRSVGVAALCHTRRGKATRRRSTAEFAQKKRRSFLRLSNRLQKSRCDQGIVMSAPVWSYA